MVGELEDIDESLYKPQVLNVRLVDTAYAGPARSAGLVYVVYVSFSTFSFNMIHGQQGQCWELFKP